MTGTRCRPWLPRRSELDWDNATRCTDPRADPGLSDTLLAAVDAHPRFARAYAITAALAFVAVLSMLWRN